ncbi:MAG: hypothetical protein IKX54_02185 [Lachnospiraceae bacterium]|nr:hypothetical protein [Lachnospiraceae bacterium]
MISLTRQQTEAEFASFCEELFRLPEIESIKARSVTVRREDLRETAKEAAAIGYHDCFSDIDMGIRVCLPADGSVTPEEYMRRIDRFGVTDKTALGWMFVPENAMYRIIFRSGMRYDFGFEFCFEDGVTVDLGTAQAYAENANWPLENIRRFWFVQIQALAKLYRRDYLIGAHLANMNCNETLVMQMVLRDIKYGTNHHRYGYAEESEYVKDLGKVPYAGDDATFDRIADRLYAAALTYDRLAKEFYPEFRDNSEDFFAIWDCYDRARAK